jgi:hypothetical protein
MAVTLQNLRAIGTGVEPTSLLPGQLAFNVTDKVIYVGDGSNFKTQFDGTQVAGVPGEGWYTMPMDLDALSGYYIINPEFYGNVPQDRYTLTWNAGVDHAVWAPLGGNVYITSNAAVAAAPGSTLTAKINAINIIPPLEGDTTIVVGTPGQTYEGLYFYDGGSTEWVLGAHYAYPEAVDVPFNNATSGLTATNVQNALDEIATGYIPDTTFTAAGDLLVGTGAGTYTALADGAANYILQSNGDGTLSWVANSAGDVTSVTGTLPITVNNTNPQTPVVGINAATTSSPGAVQLTDSVSSASTTTAATPNAVKSSYDLANAALPKAGGTMTGNIVFNNGQPVDAGTY